MKVLVEVIETKYYSKIVELTQNQLEEYPNIDTYLEETDIYNDISLDEDNVENWEIEKKFEIIHYKK